MDLIKAPEGVSNDLFEKITWMQIGVIRKSRKIKQGDISDVTGIAQTTLSHIEHGRMVPSEQNQHVLATYFNRDDWKDDSEFDWEANAHSTSNLTLFIHELQSTIDWSIYNHLVAKDIGMNDGLQQVLKNRGSLAKKTVNEAWDKAVLDWNKDRDEQPEDKRIPKYYKEAEIYGNDDLEGIGILIEDNAADTMPRPRSLEDKEEAYALVINSEFMQPRLSIGDTVFVDPSLIPAKGDDVVIQLEYRDRTVAVVREIVGLHIDEGGTYCAYDLEPIWFRAYAHFKLGQYDNEMLQQGEEALPQDHDEVFEDSMKDYRLVLGIDDEGQCHHISGQVKHFIGDMTTDPPTPGKLMDNEVISAKVHVIVGVDRKAMSNAERAKAHPLESKRHRMSAASGKFGVSFYGAGPFGNKNK
jgi:transcriptional regulator with XRE-family HTH domain